MQLIFSIGLQKKRPCRSKTHRFVLIACGILAGLLFLNIDLSAREAPKAVNGVLDLRQWDFQKDGPIRLDGQWGFYWNRFLDVYPANDSAPAHILVPGPWTAVQGSDPTVNGIGYGTYILKILLRENTSGTGIQINEFSTAYKLWINGKEVAGSGVVSTSETSGRPEYKPVLRAIESGQNELLLLAHVSNYHHFNGGLLQPIVIGDYEELAGKNTELSRYSGFLYGLLVIIGLFHLAIFMFRRKEIYNLYYSVYCLFSACAFAFTAERFLFTVMGPDLWSLAYRIAMAAPPIFLGSFVLFYDEFFKGIIKRWIKLILVLLGACIVLFVLVTPTVIGSYSEPLIGMYLLLLTPISFVVNFIAMYRKLPGSVILFLCNLFFVCSFIYEGAYIDKQLGGLTFSHVATGIYVISISFVLSRRFAATFGKVDTLSVDLIHANRKLEEQNKNLEKEVEQRTQQVVLAEKMSVLGQLTANIAHEINTPLGAIKASAHNTEESFARSVDLMQQSGMTLQPGHADVLLQIVKDALTPGEELSPKEERQQKKQMIAEMEQAGVTDASFVADYLIRAGLNTLKPEYYSLLRQKDSEKMLTLLTEQLEQVINNRNIRHATEKVSKIMFALKTYSRFSQSGETTESNLEADIDTVLTLYHTWMKRGIEVVTDYGNIPPIKCLVDELNQVWTNLIMNAVQAMGNSGILTITTRAENNCAVIRIADNGPGIPADIRDRIFDPFFTTKPHGEGSGLGLDIVKTILKKHDGIITVESVPGNTVFTVTLPYKNNGNA